MSAMRSLMFSAPMESLIVAGPMRARLSSSPLSCEWVVEAGWITRDLRSATLARRENSSRLSENLCACSFVPF